MLKPNKTKFLKYHKLRVNLNEHRATSSYQLLYGSHGLQALENGILTPQQIEATRRTLVRNLGQFGKVWIRVFPHFVVTNKPKEVRMGRGKGDFKMYVAKACTGFTMFEVTAPLKKNCLIALRKASTKLPINCQIVRGGL
jgi:large subunit ribosomal protein L16